MAHPIIAPLLELARPLAQPLGLEVVEAVFHTHQAPPVLRVDVRRLDQTDTSLEDCENMSQALEVALDQSGLLADAYVLEVSSPGVSNQLESDRDFAVFKGFMVEVQLSQPHRGKQTWVGQLLRRDQEAVVLSQRGKSVSLPRSLVDRVDLSNQSPEQG
ncbi:MAG: ribosome maturation factor RimP [Cyanobacteriota bacterium]|nr:ribosome maturation factor RimP [Cyanobacteriota bacterium]